MRQAYKVSLPEWIRNEKKERRKSCSKSFEYKCILFTLSWKKNQVHWAIFGVSSSGFSIDWSRFSRIGCLTLADSHTYRRTDRPPFSNLTKRDLLLVKKTTPPPLLPPSAWHLLLSQEKLIPEINKGPWTPNVEDLDRTFRKFRASKYVAQRF